MEGDLLGCRRIAAALLPEAFQQTVGFKDKYIKYADFLGALPVTARSAMGAKGKRCRLMTSIGRLAGRLKSFMISILFLSSLFLSSLASAAPVSPVEVRFHKSPLADYLYYLLNRNSKGFPQLEEAVPLGEIAPIDYSSFLPEDAILSKIDSYSELYVKITDYRNHAILMDRLEAGERHYPAFEAFWKAEIAPKEDETIRRWMLQNASWQPFERLQAMTRLRFPFDIVDFDIIALAPSGASTWSPPTVFTGIRVPDIAWAIGHEGTHMIVGEKGAGWSKREGADRAIELVKQHGGTPYDIEEALSVFMQVKLSQEFGGTALDYRASNARPGSPTARLLMALEKEWPNYQSNSTIDVVDFLIQQAIMTFSDKPNSSSQ